MILSFSSGKMFDQRIDPEQQSPELIFAGSGRTFIDGISKIQEVEYFDLPGWGEDQSDDNPNVVPNSYRNPHEHFADVHFVGMNPRDYNTYAGESLQRDHHGYHMCYVYHRNGKIDLLAIGFLAEVFIMNDDGKTIGRLINDRW